MIFRGRTHTCFPGDPYKLALLYSSNFTPYFTSTSVSHSLTSNHISCSFSLLHLFLIFFALQECQKFLQYPFESKSLFKGKSSFSCEFFLDNASPDLILLSYWTYPLGHWKDITNWTSPRVKLLVIWFPFSVNGTVILQVLKSKP